MKQHVQLGTWLKNNFHVDVTIYILLFSRRHLACRVHAEMAVHVSRSMTKRIIDAYVHLRTLLEKTAKIVSITKA